MEHLEVNDFSELKAKIEKDTGFVAYENVNTAQVTWYGIDTNFDAFKALVNDYATTGTLVIFVNTGDSKFFYAPTKTWY